MVSLFLHFFYLKNFHFFVSIYEDLLEPTFLTCLIVLGNLCEVVGCSVIIDFISTMFGFLKVFGR